MIFFWCWNTNLCAGSEANAPFWVVEELSKQELAAYHTFLNDENLQAKYGMTWRDILAPLFQAEKQAVGRDIFKKLSDKLLDKFKAFPVPMELPSSMASEF